MGSRSRWLSSDCERRVYTDIRPITMLSVPYAPCIVLCSLKVVQFNTATITSNATLRTSQLVSSFLECCVRMLRSGSDEIPHSVQGSLHPWHLLSMQPEHLNLVEYSHSLASGAGSARVMATTAFTSMCRRRSYTDDGKQRPPRQKYLTSLEAEPELLRQQGGVLRVC